MGARVLRSLVALCSLTAAIQAASAAPPAALDLTAYKGKVVYLDFWASWCNPCRLSFPWMSKLQQANAAKGLVVIAVNVDRDKKLADDFLGRYDHPFKVVYDPKGEIAGQYHVNDMPTSVVFGRDGKVHSTHAGFFQDQEGSYAAQIDALLAEPAP
jgi:Thiol-disulfide isomerase and thioredoxins